MRIRFALPQLNYIVFELVKIDVDSYLSNSYTPTVDETIYLAVMPQQFQYRLMARDAITQTDKKIFLNRYDFQPERCSISGYFGIEPRIVAGNFAGGWARLEQFQNDIVKKSKQSEFQDNKQKYIYGLNYYDFWWHKFGNINIDQWSLRGNSKESTQLPRYNLDFIIMGDLLQAEGTDLLLQGLKAFVGGGGIADAAISEINKWINSSDIAQYIGTGLEGVKTAAALVQGAQSFLGNYSKFSSGTYQTITNLF